MNVEKMRQLLDFMKRPLPFDFDMVRITADCGCLMTGVHHCFGLKLSTMAGSFAIIDRKAVIKEVELDETQAERLFYPCKCDDQDGLPEDDDEGFYCLSNAIRAMEFLIEDPECSPWMKVLQEMEK